MKKHYILYLLGFFILLAGQQHLVSLPLSKNLQYKLEQKSCPELNTFIERMDNIIATNWSSISRSTARVYKNMAQVIYSNKNC